MWLFNRDNSKVIAKQMQQHMETEQKLQKEAMEREDERRFKFWDCVKYHKEWSQYDWIEWVVVSQHYHTCYQDYETKVNVKLQNWWQTEVRLWWSDLEKLQGWENL